MSVFDKFFPEVWPHEYKARLRVVNDLHGGIPSDQVTIENWLKTRIDGGNVSLYAEQLKTATEEVMVSMGIDATKATDADVKEITDAAIKKVAKGVGASGFKRGQRKDGIHHGQLAYEGRCLKAALREGISVAFASGKIFNPANGKNSWGTTKKQIHGFVAEHVQVLEEMLWLEQVPEDGGDPIPVMEPTGIDTHPVHLYNGNALSQEEFVTNAEFDFTIVTDWDFTEKFWANLWVTAQFQGIGSSRSMGHGRHEMIKWEKIS